MILAQVGGATTFVSGILILLAPLWRSIFQPAPDATGMMEPTEGVRTVGRESGYGNVRHHAESGYDATVAFAPSLPYHPKTRWEGRCLGPPEGGATVLFRTEESAPYTVERVCFPSVDGERTGLHSGHHEAGTGLMEPTEGDATVYTAERVI